MRLKPPFPVFQRVRPVRRLGFSRSLVPLGREQPLDPREQRVVLVALADRDADLVGEARRVEISDEDPLLLQAEVQVAALAARGR